MTSLATSLSANTLSSPKASTPALAREPSSNSVKSAVEKDDEENMTITSKRTLSRKNTKHSQDDLRLLAISTHMTELSYTISDIQTRIFEIQELRHKSQASGDSAGTTAIIDQALMNLDERLESVSKGMKSVNESLEPVLRDSSAASENDNSESGVVLRKHASLVAEWDAVQDESDVLREELKEDKWLTVFRTVTDQADGMMSSLEKGVNRCQDFIWQFRKIADRSQSSSSGSHAEKSTLNLEVLDSLLESFEAKKKHYMPATSKVLSIIDKGVRDRVTKNGETLRRHAESAQRWKTLRDRIARTDQEMASIRQQLLHGDPSENGSQNGLLTPAKALGSSGTISRSISPFKKFARKLTGGAKSPPVPVTPLRVAKNNRMKAPSSEPIQARTKSYMSNTLSNNSQSSTPPTPDRYGHRYSQSITPDPSPMSKNTGTVKISGKQPWNPSTKVTPEDRGSKTSLLQRRAPSASGYYKDVPPVPSVGDYFRRSFSRASMASSRPWSPITSSISTNNSISHPMRSTPSRAQTPSRAPSRAMSHSAAMMSPAPRPRPRTPSHIPAPAMSNFSGSQSEAGFGGRRPFSPALSTSGQSSGHPPRPPSRSMIPVPSVKLSSPSRAGSSLSNYRRSESPLTPSFKTQAARAQTPESALRSRVQQIGIYQGTVSGRTSVTRPSLSTKLPPSSFRDGSASRASSRPPSRSGAFTPGGDGLPLHEYIPGNYRDPLDVEVANIANSIAHGLLVERVDPPLTKIPKAGEEIKAQYAFSNTSSRKVVTCRLSTLTRAGREGATTTMKVMCRVGGGWQDLSHYILNRQAGM